MASYSRSPEEWIGHILEACTDLQDFVSGFDFEAFENDRKTRSAVVRSLEVMGEASRNLLRDHPEFAAQHPDLPLRQASAMRNALIHGYFVIDWRIVWNAATEGAPELHRKLLQLRGSPSE